MKEVTNVSTDILKVHPRNTEFFDDISGNEYEQFKKSIQEDGILSPILVSPDMTIISGNQRYKAAVDLGIKLVPVMIREDLIEENEMATNETNFWRSKRTWRTTNTGMNKNVISKLSPYIGKREYYDNYIDYMLYVTQEERYKRKAFIETVNGCIGDIYSEGRGYVFNDEQLTAVKSVLGKVRSSWDWSNCCYSCRRLY